ncbi:hypothetical protein [Streptomyces sp. RerS4]|uniref:hypothetical protein n=1 Tax=Streptomyces sp. RerS4 TaxID=2942449 RepID=UPI00201BE867|nr:hypothetical protein [Streptomyces sp. RerS4]UQX02559.1 hypothetical protein M4D82_20220 [Streptomyces sp. RerS4]
MRTAVVRRTVLAASTVSLSLLVTACGSGESKPDAKTDAKASASASASAAPAAKGKSAAELTPLLVTQADLPEFKVEEDKAAKTAQAQKAEADKAACKPLVQVQTFVPLGAPVGTAVIAATEKPKAPAEGASTEEKLEAITGALSVTRTSVQLASYDGKGAEEALAAVKAATTACAGGYSVTAGGDVTKIEKVGPSASVTGGDEALAYNTTIDLKDGDKNVWEFVIVRKGNTLATFASMNATGSAKQQPAIVGAQVKKLG